MFRVVGIIMFVVAMIASDPILPVEYAIVDSPVECFAGFSATRQELFRLCGDTRGVTPTPEQITSLRGGMFTHSHVIECPTFSFGDMDSGARSGVTEIRVVSKKDGKIMVARIVSPRIIPQRDYQEAFDSTEGPICTRMDLVWRMLSAKFGFEYEVIS